MIALVEEALKLNVIADEALSTVFAGGAIADRRYRLCDDGEGRIDGRRRRRRRRCCCCSC